MIFFLKNWWSLDRYKVFPPGSFQHNGLFQIPCDVWEKRINNHSKKNLFIGKIDPKLPKVAKDDHFEALFYCFSLPKTQRQCNIRLLALVEWFHFTFRPFKHRFDEPNVPKSKCVKNRWFWHVAAFNIIEHSKHFLWEFLTHMVKNNQQLTTQAI